jgi:hypothetical protein
MLTGLVSACSAPRSSINVVENAIVYGADGRKEYYEIDEPSKRIRLANAMVALIPKSDLDLNKEVKINTDSLGDLAGLCPDELYTTQPAAALCSGVLVDWDLVLTAGHCVRVLALEELAVVFGYYYSEPGKLAVGEEDVFSAVEIVAEALDEPATGDRPDFAFIRLDRPVQPPREPVPVAIGSPIVGQEMTFIGSILGVPMKTDSGGAIGEPRNSCFLAEADTGAGASGGGAFDDSLSLLGILVRGGTDLIDGDDNCLLTFRPESGFTAQEQFTNASSALEALCRADNQASSLCRPDCGSPCEALPFSSTDAGGGCSVAPAYRHTASAYWILIVFGVVCARYRKYGTPDK